MLQDMFPTVNMRWGFVCYTRQIRSHIRNGFNSYRFWKILMEKSCERSRDTARLVALFWNFNLFSITGSPQM
jgi:hypothetical protein